MPRSREQERILSTRPRSRLSKLAGLNWKRRLLLVEAALWLGIARVSLLLPFRLLAPRLGRTMAESPAEDARASDVGDRVSWAIRVASRYTPWQTRCLAEAIAAKAMLRSRGIPTTLYLGLAKDAEDSMTAHAWLRCGGRVLTGETTLDAFDVIASFAEARPQTPARSGPVT